jgi:NADH:ubiquinone oxidoreductase subunit F (NADH-binding)
VVGAPPTGERRLLDEWHAVGRGANLTEHLARYGDVPRSGAAVIDAVDRAGLRGRGGAGFPTGRKLAAVATRSRSTRSIVVANGCEGEPASRKDHALLSVAPHLVLDGAAVAAAGVGADEIFVCVHRNDPIVPRLQLAVAERAADPVPPRLVEIPARYAASEESALVNFLNTGTARPTTKPPRPFERGVHGRPTLVANVETLAHISQISRFGPDWFRAVGTPDSPGTTLVTIDGAVSRPGVYELALGTPIGQALAVAGAAAEPGQAVLVGGYGGGWLPQPWAAGVPLAHADLTAAGVALGVASLVALPGAACGVAETARIAQYLAGESARQCGPCMFGLPAVAGDLLTLAQANGDQRAALARLQRRLPLLPGRGACGHPDGFTRLVGSALRTFGNDFREHARGRRCRWASRPVLPVPRAGYQGPEGWQ